MRIVFSSITVSKNGARPKAWTDVNEVFVPKGLQDSARLRKAFVAARFLAWQHE